MKQRYLYKERDRLGTFATYPRSAAKSAVVLAQSGFAYTGTGRDGDDRVTCVFCQAVRSSWRPEEDVEEVHRSLSPNCSLVTGQNSGNVPIVYSSSRSFQELLNAASSTRFRESTPNRRENCHSEHRENILGATNLTESENTSTLSSLKQNTSNSKSTSHNTRNNNNTSANGPTYSELGIETNRPKRPEYALKSERLKTFTNWPRDHHLQPSEIAAAGFFYAGYGDCARCFYCGGGLRNWDDEDVWVEHARWFSKCSFIRQRLGQVFVDTVQDLKKTFDKISFEAVANKMGVADIRENTLRKDPAVRKVAKLGFPMNIVIKMAKIVKAEDYILTAERLLVRLIEIRGEQVSSPGASDGATGGASGGACGGSSNDSETIRRWKHKNDLLLQQTTCKICMDNEVDIVFLPCGHPVSCTECAVALKDCPVCRAHIKGTIPYDTVANRTEVAAQPTHQLDKFSTLFQDNKAVRNIKENKGLTYAELGMITERPRFPEYALKQERIKTFSSCSVFTYIQVDNLVEAGFYYAGPFVASCFCCGGSHGDWKDFDCIWVEHARLFPGCALLKLQMGQDFIETVQQLSRFKDQITLENVRNHMEASGILCHFSRKLSFKISERPDQNSQNVLGNSMLSKEQDISSERDKEMSQQTMCTVCRDNEVEAVLMNCRHLVCCAECAIILRDCPVCKKAIRGLVRAFIS
ncbi:E3 ubiquitin-protein ligase XIAP [Biomphalaria pfeifferi]|uniref:E3 ubiquitin-protein ligase XIAP n=1 Tax=Biomphalaria pfeifferi TaxID=112525 RepID=A0AAD8AUX3_BIOPF|nr:E3 ubiquitin-protein ligase XIAP [Biomphalaria pfeifferi]